MVLKLLMFVDVFFEGRRVKFVDDEVEERSSSSFCAVITIRNAYTYLT